MNIDNPDKRPVSRLGFGSPRLNDYFGAWAIAEEHAQGLIRMAGQMNLRLHVLRAEATAEAEAAEDAVNAQMEGFGSGYGETLLNDGTAVIRIEGTLMKFSSSMSRGTSTVDARRKVRRARMDERVQRVMLIFDSPGGTVAGTQELADDVADLAAEKPTHAYVEDLCCSAALWIATQTSQISASRTSIVGSIGAVMAVADYSRWAAKQGIKVHVIASSGAEKFKGAGTAGSKVTPEQVAEWKRTLDGLAEHFLGAVAKGRGLDAKTIKSLADGRVHLADDARKLKLIDAVESLDAAMDRLRTAKVIARATTKARAEDAAPVPQTTNQPAGGSSADGSPEAAIPAAESETAPMPTQNTASAANPAAETKPAETKAATVAELKSALAGASSDFILEQAAAGATLAEAKDAFIGWQAAQIRSRDEELATARTAATAATSAKATEKPAEKPAETKAATKTGVEPMKSTAGEQAGTAGGGDVLAEFDRRVAAKMTATGKSKHIAAQEVLASDEAFRAEYSAAVQAERRRA